MHVVDRLLQAYNAKDIDAFLSCCSPDVIAENASGEWRCTGTGSLRETYGPIFEENPAIYAKTTHRTDLREYVVDERITSGMEIDGLPTEQKSVTVYRIIDDRVVHMRYRLFCQAGWNALRYGSTGRK